MDVETREFIRARLRTLDSIPTLPTLLRPLIARLNQPPDEVEFEEVVRMVACDESITAQCLQLANSPLYGRSREVVTVRGAVISLGIRKLSEILLSCCLMRLLPKGQWAIDPEIFWEHALGCALVSRQLARKVHFPNPDKVYLAGLLHDLGTLANCVALPEEFRALTEMAKAESIPLYEAEMGMLGYTHCTTGAILAEQWGLPAEVRQVILYHHEVQQARLYPTVVALVALSDSLCRRRDLGHGIVEHPDPGPEDEAAWDILINDYGYLEPSEVPRLIEELEGFVKEVRAMVNAVFRPSAAVHAPTRQILH